METDLQWLRDLYKRSWEHHEPQYSGGRQTSYGYSKDLPVPKDDVDRFSWICETYRNELVFEPGTGVFGFGVCINVLQHHPAPYPNVPEVRELLICLTDKQMFPMTTGRNVTDAYRFIESFVYTEQNKKARVLAGFKEPLRELAYYDY